MMKAAVKSLLEHLPQRYKRKTAGWGKQVAQDEKLKESTGFFESCQEVLKQNSRNVEALSLECCLSTLPFGIL